MELEQIEKIIAKNFHKPVKIYWVNPDYDWHNWMILNFDIKNKSVELIGLDDHDAKHEDKDKPEYAKFEEIKSIKSLKIQGFKYQIYEENVISRLMKSIGYEKI